MFPKSASHLSFAPARFGQNKRNPLARSVDAFEANEEGWDMMGTVVEKYLALPQT
jgi:hypothetical protein